MKRSSAATARAKLFNIRGILLLALALTITDLAVAYGLSPLITDSVVDIVNRHTRAKIIIQDLRLHPALLTLTARTIEAADPDDPARRMFLADSFRASLDVVELLSGRVSLGSLTFKQVELTLVKDAQGDFNVEKLLKKKKPDAGGQGWTDGVKDWFKRTAGRGDDWFGDAYGRAKDWVRKPAKDKTAAQAPGQREVREEPRGRVVLFYSPQDPMLKIGELRVDGGRIILTDRGGSLPPLEDVRFSLKKLTARRSGAVDFEGLAASGRLKTERQGSFDLELTRSPGRVRSRLKTEQLDLAPLKPLYEASSPVVFEAGYLTLDCKSELTAEAVNSKNKLRLEDYRMISTSGAKLGPVPASVIVEALNRRKELELSFNIAGDPDKPSMSGFESTLWDIVKEDVGAHALQSLESKTGAKLSELSEKLKKLF